MRPLVFAAVFAAAHTAYATPHNPPERSQLFMNMGKPSSELSPSNFFSPQNWQGGHCTVETRHFATGIKAILVYDYHAESSSGTHQKSETMLPRLGVGESFLDKTCSGDASVIITNRHIFVFPGARSLLQDPVENRTFVAYAGNISDHLAYSQLQHIIFFGDGQIFLATIDPSTKDIQWKKIAQFPVADVAHLDIDGNHLVVSLKNGKKENFDL